MSRGRPTLTDTRRAGKATPHSPRRLTHQGLAPNLSQVARMAWIRLPYFDVSQIDPQATQCYFRTLNSHLGGSLAQTKFVGILSLTAINIDFVWRYFRETCRG